jgi:2',3'-cyclic-nucleotide 2'-phosphodiesterase (5'-nucleotidase family)
MKYYFLIMLTLLLCVFPVAGFGAERTLNILYTGGLNGQLEPCGCSPMSDFGGMARLSGFLSAQRETLSPYILIDAGNFTSEDTAQGRMKADAMLHAFNIMKYDAVALFQKEQSFARDFLSSLLDKYGMPALSLGRESNKSVLIIREPLIIHVSVDPEDCPDGLFNILLTDHPVTVAEGIKGCDVIVSSSGDVQEEPRKIDDTLFVTGYPRGEKLGILSLSLDDNDRVFNYSHDWLSVGNDIEEDVKVRDVLDDYDAKVAKHYKESVKPLPGTTYLGVSKCAECHQLFFEQWEKTRHAHAFTSLEQTGKAGDPECIVCHSVGFGEKGGFFNMESTPELANVQCEECHGLDREHLDDYSKPMKPVTESVCLKCHTKENSPEFNYMIYYEKIKH